MATATIPDTRTTPPAIIEYDISALEQRVTDAWAAYQQKAEPLGLDFGKACYEWRGKNKAQGSHKGLGFEQLCTKLEIPRRTAYYWIHNYEVSIRVRQPFDDKPQVEPEPVPVPVRCGGAAHHTKAADADPESVPFAVDGYKLCQTCLTAQRNGQPSRHEPKVEPESDPLSLLHHSSLEGLPRRWHKYEREEKNGCTLPDLRRRINEVAKHFDDPFAFLGLTCEHKVPTGTNQAAAMKTRQTLDIPAQWKTPDGKVRGTTNVQYTNGQLLNRLITAVENGHSGKVNSDTPAKPPSSVDPNDPPVLQEAKPDTQLRAKSTATYDRGMTLFHAKKYLRQFTGWALQAERDRLFADITMGKS